MTAPIYSFIIPVYNRPVELEKLLESLSKIDFARKFEVVVIEDGSSIKSDDVCSRFRESVNISYFFKPNTGPGDSRNYGMKRAQGNYFIILDSDCIVPPNYLNIVDRELVDNYVDCYGGPDAAHESFSHLQKAINYSMTSFLTTGGIRGGGEKLGKFQPRSFNMGLSKNAFNATGGFSTIHPGEDPDLSLRLWQLGFKTALYDQAFVYHERRISWSLFYKQVNKFGAVRVILNKWHPSSARITYWLPSIFLFYVMLCVLCVFLGYYVVVAPLMIYLLTVWMDAIVKNGVVIGCKSLIAVLIQFVGYGIGYLKSYLHIVLLKKDERKAFPKLFFES